MKITVIFGANMSCTLKELQDELVSYAPDVEFEFVTSNREGDLIDAVQNCDADALIINVGGYTHTSVAIADALSMLVVPKIEVHLTNIEARESYRRFSVTASKCDGMIGYKAAIDVLKRRSK